MNFSAATACSKRLGLRRVLLENLCEGRGRRDVLAIVGLRWRNLRDGNGLHETTRQKRSSSRESQRSQLAVGGLEGDILERYWQSR